MQLLKVLFLLIVLVAVIEAQKGGTKRPKPANVPQSPSGRKTPQPKPTPAPRAQPQQPQEPDDSGSAGNAIEEPDSGTGESGPEPPAIVPQTSFTCDDKPYQPGMYADMEVDCSVYHMCFDGRKESFLCGTGTMFNQEILSCDHPGKVNCANSPQFYEANTELGKPGAEPSSGSDSGSKGAPAPRPQQPQQPPARPRVQQPSKTNQPKAQPRPQQPQQPPARPRVQQPSKTKQPKTPPKPFVDDENPEDEPDEAPEERPAPVPQPKARPSKTSPQPKKSPVQPKKPIVQSYDDGESENTNVRRAYRARY